MDKERLEKRNIEQLEESTEKIKNITKKIQITLKLKD